MSGEKIVSLVIVGIISLPLIVLGIFFLKGRGANFIAGYNTMSPREKRRYDSKALCKFMGKIVLPIGLLIPLFALGEILDLVWITYTAIALILVVSLFAIIYANTKNRFKKKGS